MPTGVRWGPVLMLVAALSFTLMVTCVKVASSELTVFELVFWRGLVSVPVCGLLVGRGSWRIHDRRTFAVRASFGFLAMFCYFSAAAGMAIADLTLVGRLQPVAIALVAPLLVDAAERADHRTWGASLLGVAGCAVLLAPELAGGSVAGLFALGAIGASAVAHTMLRRLGRTDSPRAVVFWFQLTVTALAGLMVLLQTGQLPQLPSADALPWVVGVGVCAASGQSFMTRAYQLDRAAVVAAASHASPVFAVIIDVLFFERLPTLPVVVGGSLVMVAALSLVFHQVRSTPEEAA